MLTQVGLQFTNECHGCCIMCDNKLSKRPFEYFPKSELGSVIKQIRLIGANGRCAPTGVCGDGEAVYHPEFEDMIEMVAKDLYWCFGSNCDAMTPEKSYAILDNEPSVVSLSIDATTPETLKKIRPGVNFQRAVDHALQFIEEAKRRPVWDRDMFVQFVVMKQNAHELNDWVDFWLPLVKDVSGFKLHIKQVFVWPRITEKDASLFWPAPKLDYRFDTTNPKIQMSGEVKDVRASCQLLWSFMWVMSDGAYNPCCMCADDVWGLGNVFESSIVGILNSAKMVKYQGAFKRGEYDKLPLCGRCK
jgi:hypothetical protein